LIVHCRASRPKEIKLLKTPDSTDVQHALSLLLKEPYFTAAPKSSAFLSYVVAQTLNGNGHRLKAYTIAVEALGKPYDFDPQNDPAVRVMAYRIRAALDDYNAKPNTANACITLKSGSYIAVFTMKKADVMYSRLLPAC